MKYTKLSDYDYQLPDELIAQFPVEKRDESRLMIIDKKTGTIKHGMFRDLLGFFNPGDQLILNTTKVLPARLKGKKATGAAVEILLSKEVKENVWEVICKPARKLPVGTKIVFGDGFEGLVIEEGEDGIRTLEFKSDLPLMEAFDTFGELPLPPYIQRNGLKEQDKERYQTVYADQLGAVAAPTAGLHFTQELLDELHKRKVQQVPVTLHVGLGTFKPVQTEDIREHPMHTEWCDISQKSADLLNHGLGALQLCVGTTACRTVETAADVNGAIHPGSFHTNIFIYPGYTFKFTKALLTNFHLPKSTLLMLVSSFGGYELIREAYQIAIRERYRFYSYGDAMLLI